MGETADRGKNDECESGGYHTNAPQHMWGAHRRFCGDRLRPRSQKVAHRPERGMWMMPSGASFVTPLEPRCWSPRMRNFRVPHAAGSGVRVRTRPSTTRGGDATALLAGVQA
jgi:hypothetical protein